MKVYTYSEARQRLAQLLDLASTEGEVRIRRRDGQTYVLRPLVAAGSPLDVPSLDLGLSSEEIVGFVCEVRREKRLAFPRREVTSPLGLGDRSVDQVAEDEVVEPYGPE